MPNNTPGDSTSFNISSSVLFHFTKSMDNLLNILENDFSPRYCPEYGLYDDVLKSKEKLPPSYARPMVCFCDLPLSLIKKQLKNYGAYGIGLDKEWGMKMGITPVFYLHNRSHVLETVRKLLAPEAVNPSKRVDESPVWEGFLLMAYAKPYSGPAWRENKFISSVRFYDEREWRFSPRLMSDEVYVLKREHYSNVKLKAEADSRLAARFKLRFTPDDIQYIILQDDSEILPMIRQLERIKHRYRLDDVKILTTTIMTVDRIWADI